MYSSLFRELHASRLQQDMPSTEERELTAGPDDDVRNEVMHMSDAAAISDQHAIFESRPELMEDQELVSLGNNNMTTYMQDSRGLHGPYNYGMDVSIASPDGAFVNQFVRNDHAVFGIPYILQSIQHTGLVACPALTMAAVVLPKAFDTSQLQQQQQQQQQQEQQQQPTSLIDARQVQVAAAIPSTLVGLGAIADAAEGVTVSSSSSSSSSPSSSSLSVMSASGGGGGGGGCTESPEDGRTAAADDDPGCSSSSNSQSPHHSGIFSNRCEEGRDPRPPTVGCSDEPTLHGGPSLSTAAGGSLDRSSPAPDVLHHDPVTFDHRRNSLELSSGRRLVDAPSNHLSQPPGVAAAAAGDVVPSHLRRASIPCMSSSATRGLTRGGSVAGAGGHRPSVPALDYESLKVKLEELTGTVTDGKRAKEGTTTTGGERSRRTSLVSLTHPPSAAVGSTALTSQVDRLTPTLTSTTTMVPGEGAGTDVNHTSFHHNGFSASYAVAEADEETDCHHHQLQSTTCALQPQDLNDAIASIAKNLPSEDLSSSSSSSTTSSLSSSLSSSSSWDKLRLQCVIEHVLQYDVRLHEILKRHELETAAIQMKHRFQWMELEKWLTQRFGDQWRKFITIPALSAPSESVSTSPWRYPAGRGPVEVTEKTGQREEEGGCSICVQNSFDPLQTIKEGQFDEDQLDSSPIRICQQHTTDVQHANRPVGDPTKLSAFSDHAGRRGSTDVCVDTPQRPRAISLSNVLLVGDKAAAAAASAGGGGGSATGDKAESRICQNIASSLARRQSSVAIMNPNSSRLHRHNNSKEVAPNTKPDTSTSTRLDPSTTSTKPDPSAALTRPDPSVVWTRPDSLAASTRPDSSAASTRPDSLAASIIRPDSSASSRPSTPLQGDYRQLLLLAQMLQNQSYHNSRMTQFLLPNAFPPSFPSVPFQTTNAAAWYGYDPAALLMALNSGVISMEAMGSENGFDLNACLRPGHALHVEVPPQWTTSGHQSALKNPSLQVTGGEEMLRGGGGGGGLPVGYVQPLNGGYPIGLPQDVSAGIGYMSSGQTLQGHSFPGGLLPSHLASCQLPSMAPQQNSWLLRGSGADCPMTFVTPSSTALNGYPYAMLAPSPAFSSLLKDYGELM